MHKREICVTTNNIVCKAGSLLHNPNENRAKELQHHVYALMQQNYLAARNAIRVAQKMNANLETF